MRREQQGRGLGEGCCQNQGAPVPKAAFSDRQRRRPPTGRVGCGTEERVGRAALQHRAVCGYINSDGALRGWPHPPRWDPESPPLPTTGNASSPTKWHFREKSCCLLFSRRPRSVGQAGPSGLWPQGAVQRRGWAPRRECPLQRQELLCQFAVPSSPALLIVGRPEGPGHTAASPLASLSSL